MIDYIIKKLFDKKQIKKPVTILTVQKERRVSAIKNKPSNNTCLSKYFDGLKGLNCGANRLYNGRESLLSQRFYRW